MLKCPECTNQYVKVVNIDKYYVTCQCKYCGHDFDIEMEDK